MEYIYKGTIYTAKVKSSVLLTRAVLFNPSTKWAITATLEVVEENTDDYTHYTIRVSETDTKAAKIGVYNLELYSGSDTENSLNMAKHITNFATVIDTSASNQE